MANRETGLQPKPEGETTPEKTISETMEEYEQLLSTLPKKDRVDSLIRLQGEIKLTADKRYQVLLKKKKEGSISNDEEQEMKKREKEIEDWKNTGIEPVQTGPFGLLG